MRLCLIAFHANFPPYAAHIPRVHPGLFIFSLSIWSAIDSIFQYPWELAVRCPDFEETFSFIQPCMGHVYNMTNRT